MAFDGGINEAMQGEKRRADLYSRIYKWAAEDFVATSDHSKYSSELRLWMLGIEQKLDALFKIVSSHTHKIAPHTHQMPPHTHIGFGPGAPTSPQVAPDSTLPNQPIEGLVSTHKSQMLWRKGTVPVYKNTTGTIPNLSGNRIVQKVILSESQDKAPQIRRSLNIPILNTQTIPPYIEKLKA